MTCREEILNVTRLLSRQRPCQTFSVDEVVTALADRGSKFLHDTIRYHVTVVMCVNCAGKDAAKYRDLKQVDKNRYRLTYRHTLLPSASERAEG